MEKGATNVKVPLISKIAYGMGDVGCNFSWMFVGNFLMIFYTDVFGIGMGAVAALMLFVAGVILSSLLAKDARDFEFQLQTVQHWQSTAEQ